MLKSLWINNYLLIDELNVSFNNRLTIITGETGAGKSILIEAILLLLGKRAHLDVLNEKSKKCVVEGVFLINNNERSLFESCYAHFEKETIILKRKQFI